MTTHLLPGIMTFPDLLKYFEQHEITKPLTKVITDWLTEHHRMPNDVADFSLGARTDFPDTEELASIRMPITPIYELAVTFQDGSEGKATFMLWKGVWLH